MPPRLRSLNDHAETFARVSAPAGPDESATAGFERAWALGVSGLDSPVWLTADGMAVLAPQATIGSRLRRRPIADVTHDQLPPTVVTLVEVLARAPLAEGHLLLDVPDDATFTAVIDTVRAHDPGAESRLWLCRPDLPSLMAWRERTTARLVNSVRLGSIDTSSERWLHQLAERSIDALCLHHGEWSGGLIALAHRFERLALARGPEHEREVATVLDTGIDGVSCTHPDRLMAVAALYYPARYGR